MIEVVFLSISRFVTAEHAKYFILAVCYEFEDDLLVVFDGASCFCASAVTVLMNWDIDFVQLLAYRPGLNLVEACWRQLESAHGNRYFESTEELMTTIDSTLYS